MQNIFCCCHIVSVICRTEQKADWHKKRERGKAICFSKKAANLRIFPTVSKVIQQHQNSKSLADLAEPGCVKMNERNKKESLSYILLWNDWVNLHCNTFSEYPSKYFTACLDFKQIILWYFADSVIQGKGIFKKPVPWSFFFYLSSSLQGNCLQAWTVKITVLFVTKLSPCTWKVSGIYWQRTGGK